MRAKQEGPSNPTLQVKRHLHHRESALGRLAEADTHLHTHLAGLSLVAHTSVKIALLHAQRVGD